jgi:hypothetical protein
MTPRPPAHVFLPPPHIVPICLADHLSLTLIAAMFSDESEIDEETKTNKRYAGLEGYDIK